MGQQAKNKGLAGHAYDVLISISSDYCRAYISIELHDVGVEITTEDILDALRKKNICYGIDLEAIAYYKQNPSQCVNVLIASGFSRENGRDGNLIVHVSKEHHVQPKILANGRVDYKDIHFVQTAEAGAVLATRTLPTAGMNGMTVTGREIKAKPGKQVKFKPGKNVRISDDGLRLISDKSGSVQYEGQKISILEILELRCNVGPETGNINFDGKVVVYGNVLSGYEIISGSSVEINGIIESARVTTKGDLVINGGVQGNDVAEFDIGGDLKAKFLNNAHARVAGNILCDSMLHCHITCGGSIRVEGKRGVVLGGELNVRMGMSANSVGSEMGTLTKIRLGVDERIMDMHKSLVEEIDEIQDKTIKLKRAQSMINKHLENKTSTDLSTMLEKTQATLIQTYEVLSVKQEQLKDIHTVIDRLKGSRLRSQMVYPGVKIHISHSTHIVREAVQAVQFQWDDGDIRMLPY